MKQCFWQDPHDTVDGSNPAPVEVGSLSHFLVFHTSQVVQDFSHQQYSRIESRFPDPKNKIGSVYSLPGRMCLEP